MLSIAPSSYYYQYHHKTVEYDEQLISKVTEAFKKHHGSFGRRVLKKVLAKEGITLSEYKIAKILKKLDYRSKYGRPKGKNVYTSPNTEKYIAENLYKQLTEQEKQQEIWSMDFTEQVVNKKKIYTCGIISKNKKILVGYQFAKSITAKTAIDTLNKAIAVWGKPYMVMSDRGCQFTSKTFHDIIEDLKIRHSMSRPHTPADNIFIETFWKSMKTEIGKLTLLTNEEMYKMVVSYYINYYNNERPHSALGYVTPMENMREKIVI